MKTYPVMISKIIARTPYMTPISLLALSVAIGGAHAASHPEKIHAPASSGRFQLLSEPSGLTALDDDTFIVVEDEATRALRRLSLTQSDAASIRFTEHDQAAGKDLIQRMRLAPLDDLEGIARISSTQFMVVGSHQKASRGKQPEREKMVLFNIEGDEISGASVRRDLFDQIEKYYPALAQVMTQKGGRKKDREPLNIEAIAFDRKRMHLYIGLRTPVVDDEAVILRLDNALEFMAGKEPAFAPSPFYYDLNEGGVRALAYDDASDQLLIVSKRESGGKKRTRLWSLSPVAGAQPLKWKSDDKDLFDKVEGLAPYSDGILFVRDQGDDRDLNDWFVLERQQLGLGVSVQ